MLSAQVLLSSLLLLRGSEAFSPAAARAGGVGSPCRAAVRLGFFDMFQESAESKARKEAEWEAQQAMLARRRNPEAMEAYQSEVEERRAEVSSKDAELKELQKTGDIEAWEALRAEGKLQGSDELTREAGERSWGGEGLVAERIDTRLPFVDSGYVDESAPTLPDMPDLLGGLKGLFGGGEEKSKQQ